MLRREWALGGRAGSRSSISEKLESSTCCPTTCERHGTAAVNYFAYVKSFSTESSTGFDPLLLSLLKDFTSS